MSSKHISQGLVLSAVCLASSLASTRAFAQEVGANGTVNADARVVVPAPPPPPRETTTTTTYSTKVDTNGIAEGDGTNDHDKVVNHLAVGYMGVSDVPLGNAETTLSAPVIGVRYWLNRGLGLDLGLGFGFATGSASTQQGSATTTVDRPGRVALLFHGGVPLALAAGRHYTFELVPEANIGFASTSLANGTNANITQSGSRIDLGARIGAEIQFGFIGLPQLALQASVGLYLSRLAGATTTPGANANANVKTSDDNLVIGTSVQANPWALFSNNVSAFYYF